jgi:hypothetical protein
MQKAVKPKHPKQQVLVSSFCSVGLDWGLYKGTKTPGSFGTFTAKSTRIIG